MDISACRCRPFHDHPSKWSRPSFLELLMGLFADPARLDGIGQLLSRRVSGQVREIVLALAGGAMLAYEPDVLAQQVLWVPISWIRCGGLSATRTRTAAMQAGLCRIPHFCQSSAKRLKPLAVASAQSDHLANFRSVARLYQCWRSTAGASSSGSMRLWYASTELQHHVWIATGRWRRITNWSAIAIPHSTNREIASASKLE